MLQIKSTKCKVKKKEAHAKHQCKEVEKVEIGIMKMEDMFDWEKYLKKNIGIDHLVIIKEGQYSGEIRKEIKREKVFFTAKFIS